MGKSINVFRYANPNQALTDQRQCIATKRMTIKEGVAIMTLTSRIIEPAVAEEMTALTPSYRLKIIPRADGPGPAIKQLITYESVDSATKLLLRASGTVSFASSSNSDLTPFAPDRIIGAFYQIVDVTEGYGRVVHDYLQ